MADGRALHASNAQPMEWDVKVTSKGYNYVRSQLLWSRELSSQRILIGFTLEVKVTRSLSFRWIIDGASLCLFPEDSSTSMFRLVL